MEAVISVVVWSNSELLPTVRSVIRPTCLRRAQRGIDPLEDCVLQHELLVDFLRLLAVVGKIVVVTTEIRLLEAFPERNLHRDRTGRIGLKRQHGKIHQGTYVVVHRLAVEGLDLVIRLRR